MTRRILLLLAVFAAAFPAAALAGGAGGHRAERLAALEQRVDARFQTFSAHCLVDNAPARCAHVAARFAGRLHALQGRIDQVEARIKERCGQANPPDACAHAADLLAKLDAFKAKLAGYEAAIKAKYP